MAFVMLLLLQEVKGQSVLPDSIQQRYSAVPKDSNYIASLNTLATHYLKSNPTLSRKIASHAASVAPQLNYNRGYARALTILGNSYWYEGIYEFAQNYYLLAARQYQSIQDSIGLGQVYNNIGEVNKKFGDYDKALDYLLNSLSLRKRDTTIAITLYNIGELYLIKNQLDKATAYINSAMEEATDQKDERSITYSYWSLARIKTAQGNFKEGIRLFNVAIDRWKKNGETRALVQTYHDLAEALRKQNQLDRARALLTEAYQLTRKVNAPDLRVNTYLGFAKVDSTRGDYRKALHYLSLHNQLKDSVYNILKAEQIARVQIIYETERRQHEYEQIKADRELKAQQLRSKEGLIAAATSGLLVVLLLATVLFQQRSKILRVNKSLEQKSEKIKQQKEAIEMQAVALRKLNEELQNLNRTLEDRIEERSKQLMLQNQKLAEYSFVNAHKLRAPVASIIGLIQLLNQVEPHEREVILSHLRTCSLQLDTVIQEISRNLESDTEGYEKL